MNKIKAILNFVLTVLKVSPIKTASNNGFMIYSPISPADLQKLDSLCKEAGWTCTNFPEEFSKSGVSISDEQTWIGLQSSKKVLSIDELMTQATQITSKS